MVNPRERMAHYRRQGLEVMRGFEPAGAVFPEHSHGDTILYTFSGSLVLKLCVEPVEEMELRPGSEVVIGAGVEHSAVVGETGWGYVAAWDPNEAGCFEMGSQKSA